jgi:anti-anti-sigma factor
MQNVLIPSPVSIVQPCGHISAANAADFQKRLTTAVSSRQAPALLVDMSNVESLDSAGLMVLISALTLAQQSNQRLGLCSISPAIRIIFELTQLDRAFEIFENRSAFEAAIA